MKGESLEIIIDAGKLKEGVGKVEKVVPSNPAIQVINGIRIQANEDVSFFATDLENTVRAGVKGEVKSAGDCVIPGKRFAALVKSLDGEVEITAKSGEVKVVTGGKEYKFLAYDAGEYPVIPDHKETARLTIPPAIFYEALNLTKSCIDPDEPRPHFRGILFDVKDSTLNVVGTDTRQLALYKYHTAGEGLPDCQFLLPLKTASLILSAGQIKITAPEIILCGDSDGKFISRAIFSWGDHVIWAQLLSGVEDFPDYDKVIPKKTENSAIFNRADLISILKRLSIFTSERHNKFSMMLAKETAELAILSPETGNARESIKATYRLPQDEAITTYFPVNMFMANMSNLKSDQVRMSYTDGDKPVIIEDPANEFYTAIVMPLKGE